MPAVTQVNLIRPRDANWERPTHQRRRSQHRTRSNERMQRSGSPGRLRTAGINRSIEEPGRPSGVPRCGNGRRETITAGRRRLGVGGVHSSEEAG